MPSLIELFVEVFEKGTNGVDEFALHLDGNKETYGQDAYPCPICHKEVPIRSGHFYIMSYDLLKFSKYSDDLLCFPCGALLLVTMFKRPGTLRRAK